MKKISIKLFNIALAVTCPSYVFAEGAINRNVYGCLLGIFALLLIIVTNQIFHMGEK